MDSIQSYGGSDTESDLESDGDLTNKDSSIQEEKSRNFFSLDTWGGSLTNVKSKKTISIRKEDTELNHDNGNGSFSIPDGDYWKGFIPDSSNTDISNSKSDLSLRQGDVFEERTLQNKPANDIKKRPYPSGHSSKYFRKEKRVCSSQIHNRDEEDTGQHSQGNIINQQENRNIFYVHSKVTPYLSSNCSCKCASKPSSSWEAHDRGVNRISWNRSNYSHLLLTAGMDSLIKVWNVWSILDNCVSTITHHSKAVRNAIWGMQGRSIISCSYDKTAIVTDVESGTIQSRYVHPGFVVACTLHPNNPNCFVTGCDNLIQFWDVRTPLAPVKVLTYKDDTGQPQDLLFIQSGNELISCSDIVSRDSSDRTIMAWDVKSGNVISNQIYQEKYTCTRLKKCPSDSKFLAQTQGGYVALFSANRPYKIDKKKRFEGHEMQGYNIGFDISHDGSLVYSGSAEGGIHCYDYRSARLLKKCVNDSHDVITDVACHPVLSTVIASCTWGGSLTLWQ